MRKKSSLIIWKDFPKEKPELGEMIVVCYKVAGQYPRTEVYTWQWKDHESRRSPFKWFYIGKLPIEKDF